MDTTYHQSRVNFYALLSRLHIQEIDAPLLQTLLNDEVIGEYFPNLLSWEKCHTVDAQTLITNELNADYTNLYLMHLVPYETFYTREDQMIESGGDNPVREFYEAYDFRAELDVARAISPDHIGIELEFMYLLAKATLDAKEANDGVAVQALMEVQKTFLQMHLLPWVPLFLINVQNEAATPLYHDLAVLSLEFLLSDYESMCLEA